MYRLSALTDADYIIQIKSLSSQATQLSQSDAKKLGQGMHDYLTSLKLYLSIQVDLSNDIQLSQSDAKKLDQGMHDYLTYP